MSTLKTRIKLKYDTLANWTQHDPVLLAGEIAIVDPGTTIDGHNTILLKSGNGTSKFSELDYIWGRSADVYDWAKAATKPSYSYSEISGTPTIPSVGNGKITITQNGKEMGSFTLNQSGPATIEVKDTDSDTNTQYQLSLSGHTLKLQSKEKGTTEWKDIANQSFTLPDNNTTYTFASTATSGAYFKVTPSGGTQQTVYIDGLGSAAFKAETAFDAHGAAAAVLGASSDAATANTVHGAKKAVANAQTAINSHIGNTSNPHGVTAAQVGLGSVVNAGRDTTVTANSNNYITSGAVKSYVDDKVSGVTTYLGTVKNATELTALNPKKGDFCRVSAAYNGYHASDMLICETAKSGDTAATWSVVHGEIDQNTWVANSANAAGYVAAGKGQANKVWKTDANGNPAWRDDSDTKPSNGALKDASGAIIFTANQATDVQILIIDCGSSTDVI